MNTFITPAPGFTMRFPGAMLTLLLLVASIAVSQSPAPVAPGSASPPDGNIVTPPPAVAGAKDEQAAQTFALSQNYPNPFNPTTKIEYSIEKAGMVSLRLFNILGSEVATLVNGPQEAGRYAVQFNTNKGTVGLSSGVYFYRLETGSLVSVKKLVLMR